MVVREFYVRRAGWFRWQPVYTTEDARELPLAPDLSFFSQYTALRVVSIARQQWYDGQFAKEHSDERIDNAHDSGSVSRNAAGFP
jgi:hypothetical protein